MKGRDIIWLIIVLLLLGAGGYGWYKWQKAEQMIVALTSDNEILTDNLDQERKVGDFAVASRDEFARLFQEEQKKVAAMGLNPNSIRYITRIQTETKDSIVFQTLYDTIIVDGKKEVVGQEFNHEDQWATISVKPAMFGWWSLDYTVRDTIDLVAHKTGTFFQSRYNIVGSSANPNTDIYGLDGLLIEEKKKRWGLGIQVGYGATVVEGEVRLAPTASVGVSYSLVRW